MTDTLTFIQNAALQQLAESALLQNNASADSALQTLQQQCYPAAPYAPYNQRPGLVPQFRQLLKQLGCNHNQLARLLILKLIADFSLQRLPLTLTLTSDIISNFHRSIERIYQLWTSQSAITPDTINDSLLKDIGLLTGALLPCTERVVEPYSAIQRSLVFRDGVAQSWRFIRALVAARGNKPVCRLHIHLAEISGLTAAGWRLTCQQLAQLLLLNPRLKGVVGASWFYDPALSTVSPHLGFIGQQLRDMQASWFFSHSETAQSGALVRTSGRQRAYETGQYQPQNYVIFIPRASILAWYRGQVPC